MQNDTGNGGRRIPTLSCEILDECGEDAALEIRGLFNSASLPEPREGEYFNSNDSGTMIFLNEEAIVLRLRSSLEQNYRHPYILRPFAVRELGGFMLEFLPGVKTPSSREHNAEVHDALEKDSFLYWDTSPRNCGVLPNGQGVLTDIGAVRKVSKSIHSVFGEPEPQPPAHDIQDELFGDLAAALDKAWPKDELTPDWNAMEDFFAACRRKKKEGVLVAAWTTMNWAPDGVKWAAYNYGKRRAALAKTP